MARLVLLAALVAVLSCAMILEFQMAQDLNGEPGDARGGDAWCYVWRYSDCPDAPGYKSTCAGTKCMPTRRTMDGVDYFYYLCSNPGYNQKVSEQFPSGVGAEENGWKNWTEHSYYCWQKVTCNKGCSPWRDTSEYYCWALTFRQSGVQHAKVPDDRFPPNACVIANTLSSTGSSTVTD